MLDDNELLFDELYEKTKDCGRVQFVRLLMEKEREIKKLEEEYQIIDSKLFFTKYELDMRQKSIDNKLSQQKEFIVWLEEQLNICDGFIDTIKSDLEEISYAGRKSGKTYIETQIMKNEIGKKCYEEVLSKYKEIIGVKDE